MRSTVISYCQAKCIMMPISTPIGGEEEQRAGPSTGVGGGREVQGATASVSCLGVAPRMADRAFKGRSAGDVSPGAACLATRRRVACRGCACHALKTRVRFRAHLHARGVPRA